MVALGLARGAAAQSGQDPEWGTVQIAPFAGYQFGGSVRTLSGANVSLSGVDYGGTLTVRISESWSVEALYSRQSVELTGPFDATVERYMGGIVEERDHGRSRFFGVALVGATRYVPALPQYGSQAVFTIGLGLGVKSLLAKHIGFRLDARGFYAITEAGGGLFCSGGCLFTFNGSGLWQGDVSGGIVLAF
jgi:hypothetical protein